MLMTKQQFQDSIRARKPMNVWFLGEKIEDVTTIRLGGQLQRYLQDLRTASIARTGRI